MTIAIPATGEHFDAQLVADERGVLHLLQVRPRVDYLLTAVTEDRLAHRGCHAG
jgi:hypothetical protein